MFMVSSFFAERLYKYNEAKSKKTVYQISDALIDLKKCC